MGEFELSENEKFVCTFSSLLINPIEEVVKANLEHSFMMLQRTKIPQSDINKTDD